MLYIKKQDEFTKYRNKYTLPGDIFTFKITNSMCFKDYFHQLIDC